MLFIKSPLSTISLNPDLFDLSAGFLGAGFYGLVYVNLNKLNLMSVLDTLTPLFATMQVAIGLANLASGRLYGAAANLPWSVFYYGEYRHPSQVYEIISAVIILIIIYVAKIFLSNRTEGTCVMVFTGLSATSHLFLETFRAESHVIFMGIRTVQLISWVIMGVASIWIINVHEKYQDFKK